MNQECTVNQKVRQFRLEKNRTQLAIAELIGVSERHYRKLESGERSFLFEHVLKIAEYLATPIDLFYPSHFSNKIIQKNALVGHQMPPELLKNLVQVLQQMLREMQ